MIVRNEKDVRAMVRRLVERTAFSVDTETTGLSPYHGARIFGVSFALPTPTYNGVEETFYLPLGHWERNPDLLPLQEMLETISKSKSKYNLLRQGWLREEIERVKREEWEFRNHPWNLEWGWVRELLKPLFCDPGMTAVYWNKKFDAQMFWSHWLPTNHTGMEAMLGLHLSDENRRRRGKNYRLKPVGVEFFGGDADAEEREMKEWGKRYGVNPKSEMWKLPLELVAKYAEQDAALTWRLSREIHRRLDAEGLVPLWREISAYSDTVARMEKVGLLVDPEATKEKMEKNSFRIAEITKEIDAVAPGLNPNSVPQLRKLLKVMDTSAAALQQMDHPVAKNVVEIRMRKKANSTYYQNFLDLRDPEGYLHPTINIHGTVTGRGSCSAPNLQNLPRNATENDIYDVRNLIIAPEGYVLLSNDFSQIELRTMAHYCEDPTMVQIFREGVIDLHQGMADKLGFVGEGARDRAKTLNFGLLYGMTAHGLSKRLNTSVEEAQEILNEYFARFPTIHTFIDEVTLYARRHMHIKLWTGRIRRFTEWYECKDALNTLIQGGAAEILRHSIQRLDRLFLSTRDPEPPKMCLQVHDDILMYVREDLIDHWVPIVQGVMSDWPQFNVPIKAESKYGKRWSKMTVIGKE
jgi:DNA polymerase-1